MIKKFSWLIIFFLFSLPLWSRQSDVILKASGATFPYPLYKTWLKAYHVQTGVRISYEAIGSGAGIKDLLNQKVDFCGSDAFLSDKDMADVSQEILHIPSCLGAVVISYNLPGRPQIKLTPQLITAIFSGRIKSWSDKRITAENPGINLPNMNINVVRRSDSSGTTFIFTNYLAAVSPRWARETGSGKTVKWPTGIGAETNRGMVDIIRRIPGTIGYVEMTYAKEAKLPMARLRNKSGNFIAPTLESVSAAADVELPPDTRTLIVDTSAPDGYPISGFTWLLFYKEQSYRNRSLKRTRALAKYLWWMVHEGQQFNKNAIYGALSKEAVKKAEHILLSMTYKGMPLVEWKKDK
jgi:phosphate transport system substrate-binding protein